MRSGCHNVSLHGDNDAPRAHMSANKNKVSGTCTAISTKQDEVFLGVVPVCLTAPYGTIKTCVFMDNGSDATLVKRSIADKLGLTGNEATIKFGTLNGTSSHH